MYGETQGDVDAEGRAAPGEERANCATGQCQNVKAAAPRPVCSRPLPSPGPSGCDCLVPPQWAVKGGPRTGQALLCCSGESVKYNIDTSS